MNVVTRIVITLLAVVMMTGLMTTRTKTVTEDWTDNELEYALRVATQDATSVLMDENYSLDGNTIDPEDITVNLDRAMEQFDSSFQKNIGSHIDPEFFSNMNIPLYGYVGYRYIVGRTYDGGYTFPYAYTCVRGNTMYSFTLNDDTVFVSVNDGAEQERKLSSFSEHFFSSSMTNEEYRAYTVMSAISQFLTLYNGTDTNLIARSMGSTIQFELGRADFANDDPSVMTEFASVIDGPGFFAVTDMMEPQVSGIPVRIFTFGGSELLSKY